MNPSFRRYLTLSKKRTNEKQNKNKIFVEDKECIYNEFPLT